MSAQIVIRVFDGRRFRRIKTERLDGSKRSPDEIERDVRGHYTRAYGQENVRFLVHKPWFGMGAHCIEVFVPETPA